MAERQDVELVAALLELAERCGILVISPDPDEDRAAADFLQLGDGGDTIHGDPVELANRIQELVS